MKIRSLVRWIVVGSLIVSTVGVGAEAVSAAKGPKPLPRFAEHRGEEAIQALGARLHDTATKMGLSDDDLRSQLRRDHSMVVSDDGQLAFKDSAPEAFLSPSTAPSWTSTPTYATASTFQLHSRPNSTKRIFLDFNGHSMTSTRWNSDYGRSLVSAPFSLDYSPNTWSSYEHAFIQDVYLSVAEDFRPFDVDVTTQDPGVDALKKSSSSDTVYGVRVVLSPTNFSGNPKIKGEAFPFTFGAGTDTPVLVYLTPLTWDPKLAAEVTSHEVGHSLGLSHDGVDLPGTANDADYYDGHGDWAPIMGRGLRRISQWSKGEYPGANNRQDDLAVITANGLSRAATDDREGATPAAATTLLSGLTGVASSIDWSGDTDVWKITVTARRVMYIAVDTAVAPGNPVDANVNAALSLWTGAGWWTVSAPIDTLDATFTTTLDPGTYYFRVSGAGEGNLTGGYSSYGSLGRYTIAWI